MTRGASTAADAVDAATVGLMTAIGNPADATYYEATALDRLAAVLVSNPTPDELARAQLCATIIAARRLSDTT